MTQIIGIAAYGIVVFPAALIFFSVIKAVMGLRVSADEEVEGLDFGEHGMEAYSGLQEYRSER
jgi:Amt family ammonium transporter